MTIFSAAASVLVFGCASCGSCGGDERPSRPERIRVVTFNTGLGPGMVANAAARTGPVARALGAVDHDVLCLQEVWTPEGERAVLDALGLPPENVFTADTAGEGETGTDRCEPEDLGPVRDCAASSCADRPSEDTTLCALERCGAELFTLYAKDPSCVTCLAASAGKDTDGIWDACTGRGASRIHGGRNGVILASVWPLVRREVLRLEGSGANRVALIATVETSAGAAFDVVCTHLSSGQAIPPMHTRFSSWDEERIAQIGAIARALDGRPLSLPALIVGDLNFGRAHGGVAASGEGSWAAASASGWRSPAAEREPPLCSVCAGNTLRAPDSRDKLIDHVMLRADDGAAMIPVGSERLLDRTVDIIDGSARPLSTHLSDHYGIRVTIDVAIP